MGDAGPVSYAQVKALSTCLTHKRIGVSISFAAATLFLFEYIMTFSSELRHIWGPRRITLTSVFFIAARYACLFGTLLVLKPSLQSDSTVFNNLTSISRFVTIVMSEFILAVRTWAIWERQRSIGWFLVLLAVTHGVPCIAIIALDAVSSQVTDLPIPADLSNMGFRCTLMTSAITYAYITPYILAISFEGTNLFLSLYKIVNWRKQLPSNRRVPLIDKLWRDGLLYYCWLITLSMINIGLVVQRDSPQLRQGGAQLQAVLHSVLATRIVLHMASSKDVFATPMSTTVLTDTQPEPQFTTLMMTRDHMTDIEQSAHVPELPNLQGHECIPMTPLNYNTNLLSTPNQASGSGQARS